MMGILWSEIKHSLQMLFHNPGFSIAAVAALTLGIGANTAIFTVVDAVLLKPLTYPNPSAIRKLVVWQGVRLALVGVAGGIAAAFGLTRLIATILFSVQPWDPAVFICAPLILSAVALFAVWLPARRAAKLDPMQALHME